jgi:Na+/proline symporter
VWPILWIRSTIVSGMSKPNFWAFVLSLGTLSGWLVLHDTGLVHQRGSDALVAQALIVAGSIAAAWFVVRWLVRHAEQNADR